MLKPVRDPQTGEIQHHDIYVAGKWIGSRRTLAQCIDELRRQGWPSAVMAGDMESSLDASGHFQLKKLTPLKCVDPLHNGSMR